MAKNKLTDLNNHLFAQLERLNDETFTEEQIKAETIRAKAVSSVAAQIINNAKLVLETVKLVNNCEFKTNELPDFIGIENKK